MRYMAVVVLAVAGWSSSATAAEKWCWSTRPSTCFSTQEECAASVSGSTTDSCERHTWRTIRMRGPQGQTVDAAENEVDFYSGRGFVPISSEQEFREAEAEAERNMAAREEEETFRTWAIAIACGLLGIVFLYFVRRQLANSKK